MKTFDLVLSEVFMMIGFMIITVLLWDYLDIFYDGQLFIIFFNLPIIPTMIIFWLVVLLGVYRHYKNLKIAVISNIITGLQISLVVFLLPIFIIRSYKTSFDIFGWFYNYSNGGVAQTIILSLSMFVLALIFFFSGWELRRFKQNKKAKGEELEITE